MKPIHWLPDNFKGTPLHEKDVAGGRVGSVRWDPQVKYSWDAGAAIGGYLQGLKEGRLIGTRCTSCQRSVIPPRFVCEQCFHPMQDWVVLKDTGTVLTFSLSYVNWDASRRDTPEVPAVIEIDGASPGCGILHLLGGVEPKQVRNGLRVQAVWKSRRERRGAITDIRYFKPI